jgi:guanylate kinase
MTGKVIIISAPSGCGKSTIINAILADGAIDMQFSVSATNRQPREGERNGVNYFFLTDEEFKQNIADDNFIEYEEVYPGRFYGTLRSEIDRITTAGHNVIMDIDVNGGLNVKQKLGPNALAIFIAPPSVETLRERLINRGTDSTDVIEQRVARATYEIGRGQEFDVQVVNDNLAAAIASTRALITTFLS